MDARAAGERETLALIRMESLERFDYGGLCWWCSAPADSAEHKYKRSDVLSEFGRPPYRGDDRLIRHRGNEIVADGLQGPASSHFRFSPGLCHRCNSTKSQPFDLAYASLVGFVRWNEEAILRDRTVDLAVVFGSDWPLDLVAIRQYLVKHACCRLAEAQFRIGDDLLSFLDGRSSRAPFSLVMELREDILELLGKGADRLGSLWIGDLTGWHEPESLRCRRVESHYGVGWLRFSWTYDSLGRDWPDNMSQQRIDLVVGRNLAPGKVDQPG